MKSLLPARRPRILTLSMLACATLASPIALSAGAADAQSVTRSVPAPPQSQQITLEEAIRRAIAASPLGEATAARMDALAAGRAAADTRPAASIDVTAENFGIGGQDLNRQIQVTGAYSQRIERGGKREARVGVAEAQIGVAQAEALVKRLDIAARVQLLYVDVQAAEAQIQIARERVTIAEQLAREVGRRVTDARDPLFAGTRTRTQLAEAKVDLELAEHERDAKLSRLVSLWGGSPVGLSVTSGAFLTVSEASLPTDPSPVDLAVFEARRRQASAELALQRANARTDPTISGGPRIIGTGDVALVAGFSLPLSNGALNRANIARAEADGRQVEADYAVALFEWRQQVAIAAERVTEAAHEVDAIRDRVVPGAQRTLAEVRAGYNRGGFTFMDVSMAQTALHDAYARLVRAATRYHQARVEFDRLTGRFATLTQETE